ncbi:HAD family hydrolase [Saccharopolyspora rhizosphaerae]|uniref:HAD family hydrolase n=1 Tax=Saccharopolyspora rhizosphaerae TaxID=2492662 RepID=A0A3R8PZC9_9PSEU|nr:HAD family hydrolase [Saccharopolyspora rhizosphaerae]RRO15163.1 HAD family hydrolase [Saccharopolyspora rhizosphaerae]
MREPGLVASDVDGTLLDPMERVSARTAATASRIVSAGTPFVLVTGRPPRWLPRVVEALGVAGIAVCANGAVTYDTAADRVLHSHDIDPVELHDVVRELRHELHGCAFAVERTTRSAREDLREQFVAEADFHRGWRNTDIRVAATDELTGKPAMKLLVMHPGLNSAELAAATSDIIGDRLRATYSTDSGLVELSAPGIDKAAGLAAVAAELGIARSEVIAFGDMPNDVPMLSWAGHGVAMRNAHPDALAAADEVTTSNAEDGVAQVLERWW